MGDNIEYLSIHETNDLFKATDDPRDYAIISVFLGTGIFLNELVNLKVDNVDFENKLLKIIGNRQRNIPLNDQVFEALAKWTKSRPNSTSDFLFLTTKGETKELSSRGVDKAIRKYADLAKIKSKINAQILRNTFAVNLFKTEIALTKATEILGITDSESINRYIQTAKNLGQPKPLTPEDIKTTDIRPMIKKMISKAFPTEPQSIKPLSDIKGPISPDPSQIVIGRDSAIKDIKSNLNNNVSTLLKGEVGIGKTHILKHIAADLNALYISSPVPFKNMLVMIAERFTPDYKEKLEGRATTREIVEYIITGQTGDKKSLIVIDNLSNLRVSDIELFTRLFTKFTILAATDETSSRLKQIWWKFKAIDIKPLTKETTKELIKYLTQNLSISDYELLETRLLTLSNGLPLVIVDMINQIGQSSVVTREKIRDLYHEVGVKYRDWTFAIIILWGILIMCRFVALGTHSFEGYILAGIGMAFIMVMRYFMFRMR